MTIVIRPIEASDLPDAGRICHEAFTAIATEHNFVSDHPDASVATALLSRLATHPHIYGVVAEIDGRVVGSIFVDERSPITGLGPVTVDPSVQNKGVGTALMIHMLDRATSKQRAGVRLVQASYHSRSLCLYAKLGFSVCEYLVNLQGMPPSIDISGCTVRRATIEDAEAAVTVCREVHGHDRRGEFRDAVTTGTATVVERGGRITGYATHIGWAGHAVGMANDDMKALIAAAPSFTGSGFLLPSSNNELFRWCLDHGLRMAKAMVLMSMGLYNEPRGAYLPSVVY
jgi:predicted N-acetyltransferase YhbS